MPFYEYRCSACGHEFDAMQKMSDAPLTDCPACHQPSLVKLISAAGFQLKGSGWYVTDFKDKPKKPDDKKADKPADKPSSSDKKTQSEKKTSSD
ncbi:MAG: zinc ribbon domain-containing protein [Pseudomonadota bacterium]